MIDWVLDENIKTSNDFEKLFEYVKQGKSLNIRAEAGFGKSYMIEKLIEKYGEDGVLRIAPTNVAAVRIGGKTIHGVLHIPFNNPSGYVGEKILKSIEENKNLKVICLDEQGIVGGELFNLLYQLKKRIKISFFSFGDFYQLGPVKDNNIYIDNEIVKNICDNNVCVLEYHDRCRHSPEMYKICQKIREGEKESGKHTENTRKTRNSPKKATEYGMVLR